MRRQQAPESLVDLLWRAHWTACELRRALITVEQVSCPAIARATPEQVSRALLGCIAETMESYGVALHAAQEFIKWLDDLEAQVTAQCDRESAPSALAGSDRATP